MKPRQPRILPAAPPFALERRDEFEARCNKMGELIVVALEKADGGAVERRSIVAKCARQIDIFARIEECEDQMRRLSDVEFSCTCSRGQHPPTCPIGWARAAREVLQQKIDALRQAQGDHA